MKNVLHVHVHYPHSRIMHVQIKILTQKIHEKVCELLTCTLQRIVAPPCCFVDKYSYI
jgi:hypothetical protein